MDPRDTARHHWALTRDGHPVLCQDQITYPTWQVALTCARHLQILGTARQDAVVCASCGYCHLVTSTDPVTAQEERAAELLCALHSAGTGPVLRTQIRDAVHWGNTSSQQRRSKLHQAFGVLDRYGLIGRDDTHVWVTDPGALSELVRTLGVLRGNQHEHQYRDKASSADR